MTSCLAIRSTAAEPASADGASQSVLPGVLSTSAGSSFDGRVDYSDLESPTVLALNLHGQYLSPSGFGGYLALPFSYASADGESMTVAGNPEVGGLYALRRGIVDVYARGGLALDLSPGDDFENFMVSLANFLPRPADAITTGFDSSFLRLGGGARLKSGALVVGVAGGADLEITNDREMNLLHVTTSVGIEQPRFGAAAGVTMLQSLASGDGEGGDTNYFGLQGTADVAISGKARLYGTAGVNLESLGDDETHFSVGLGVRARL